MKARKRWPTTNRYVMKDVSSADYASAGLQPRREPGPVVGELDGHEGEAVQELEPGVDARRILAEEDATAAVVGAALDERELLGAVEHEHAVAERAVHEAATVEHDGRVSEVVGDGFHAATLHDSGAGSIGASLRPGDQGQDPELVAPFDGEEPP